MGVICPFARPLAQTCSLGCTVFVERLGVHPSVLCDIPSGYSSTFLLHVPEGSTQSAQGTVAPGAVSPGGVTGLFLAAQEAPSVARACRRHEMEALCVSCRCYNTWPYHDPKTAPAYMLLFCGFESSHGPNPGVVRLHCAGGPGRQSIS